MSNSPDRNPSAPGGDGLVPHQQTVASPSLSTAHRYTTACRHGTAPTPANTKVVWYLFPEGTFSRADAGTLDLGVVRDSTLNSTNDYRYFAESWEAILPKVHTAIRRHVDGLRHRRFATDTDPSAYCNAS